MCQSLKTRPVVKGRLGIRLVDSCSRIICKSYLAYASLCCWSAQCRMALASYVRYIISEPNHSCFLLKVFTSYGESPLHPTHHLPVKLTSQMTVCLGETFETYEQEGDIYGTGSLRLRPLASRVEALQWHHSATGRASRPRILSWCGCPGGPIPKGEAESGCYSCGLPLKEALI